jgi:hypothetical protein
MPPLEEKLTAALFRIQIMEAKQIATEAVFIHLFTPLLSALPEHIIKELFAKLRTDLIVSSRSDGENAETAKLTIEEHINNLVDRIERVHRSPII